MRGKASDFQTCWMLQTCLGGGGGGGNVEEGGWEKQLTDGGRRADTEAKDCHFLASARPASD